MFQAWLVAEPEYPCAHVAQWSERAAFNRKAASSTLAVGLLRSSFFLALLPVPFNRAELAFTVHMSEHSVGAGEEDDMANKNNMEHVSSVVDSSCSTSEPRHLLRQSFVCCMKPKAYHETEMKRFR